MDYMEVIEKLEDLEENDAFLKAYHRYIEKLDKKHFNHLENEKISTIDRDS